MKVKNDTKLIELIRKLTLAQQQQALKRLKGLSEPTPVSECKKSLLRGLHPIIP